jgi:hypothetical protein
VPPEDELADEVPLREDEYEASPEAAPGPNDSGVDFAPEGDAGAEAQDDEYRGPVEDLSGELQEDAGDQASYGYDSASETARFDRPDIDPNLLTDSSGAPDESDKYRLSQSDPAVAEPTSFAEEAATAPSDEATYEAPTSDAGDDDTYSSHHPDLDKASSDEMGPATEEEPAAAFTVEEEEPAPPPVRPSSTASAKKPAAAAAPSNEPKPGQVRKSAIDEMFQRAADLKRRKGS